MASRYTRRSSYAKASSGSSDSDGSGSSDSDPDPDFSGTEADQAETQEIRCTTEHPFWVVGRGWVPAGELRDGDELVGEHEESLFVESARIDKEEADHYNFEVEDWHSYFVGEDGKGLGPAVWVHNDCDEILKFAGSGASEQVRLYNLPGAKLDNLTGIQRADQRLVVSMPYVGKRAASNAEGWLRSNEYYFKEIYRRHPEAFSRANMDRMFGQGGFLAPINDSTFRKVFPQYDVKGLRSMPLLHHHIGGG